MATAQRYAVPVDEPEWTIPGECETLFDWEYEKGKNLQWNTNTRIDWTQDLDPENPEGLPDEAIPIFGSGCWSRLRDREKANLRRHFQSWQLSQFLHGEQGALVCTAKIVQQVPGVDAKFYAATQVMDEARHVETYSRLLHEKFELAYPITPGLRTLLEQTISDRRWDMTYLGMQILIEGLALAAFQRIRDTAKNPLAASVNAYVMQDEARHVAFGRLALREYYPQLSEAERDEREQFVVEACYHMRDRFNQREVWETLGLPVEECIQVAIVSDQMRQFRTRLFTRIVPTVKDIGLWGARVQKAYADMGVLDFASIDAEAMLDNDNRVAEEFDARRR